MAKGMPELSRPTDAELEILTVFWSIGRATVRDVYEVIRRRRHAQYTTLLKFMQIMAEKRLLRRDESERAHVYEPAKSGEWTQRQLAGHFLERVQRLSQSAAGGRSFRAQNHQARARRTAQVAPPLPHGRRQERKQEDEAS
jgi:predicted transcriptional regulator